MKKETKGTEAVIKPLGYMLAVLGGLTAVVFFMLGNLGLVGNMVIDLLGGTGEILRGNLGTVMWVGVLMIIVGVGLIMIEETKEEPS